MPLAGPSMYRVLGANWAGTLLGLLEALCIPIPFVFYRYGGKIREKSALIRQMREGREKMERKRKRAEEKSTRRAQAEAEAGAAMETGAAVAEAAESEKDLEKALSEKS